MPTLSAPMKVIPRWSVGVRPAVARIFQRARRSLKYTPLAAAICMVIVGGVALSIASWDWLSAGESNGTRTGESGSTTIRNLGLVAGGIAALAIAVWRSLLAQQEAITARRGLLNARYQEGAAMLGSEVLAVRLAGIYALQHLADEYPAEYHIEVMRLLCAFVRHPVEDRGVGRAPTWDEDEVKLRADGQSAMDAISECHRHQPHIEMEADYKLDLRGADLKGLWLRAPNLSGVQLNHANLSGASLYEANLAEVILHGAVLFSANLDGADLHRADLVEADLRGAKLYRAILHQANLTKSILCGAELYGAEFSDAALTGADFSDDGRNPAEGLTQAQLDEARADPLGPPLLDGAQDADTGVPLVWQGERLDGPT